MASIHDFLCEAQSFPVIIVAKQSTLENVCKQRHFAALNIQRYYRGCKVRREITKLNSAAIVLQKYVRRWMVIWHLPQILKEYHDWYSASYYNKMATRIQALWRGYWVRRDQIPPKEVLKSRLAIAALNEQTQKIIQEAFAKTEIEKLRQMDKEAEKWVMFILFKLHHHLRTFGREGIYSSHNSTELSPIEELFKVLPLHGYMKDVKKRYYKELNQKAPPPVSLYKHYVLRNLEDAYKNRDRSSDKKKEVSSPVHIKKKPFVLTPKLNKKPYQKELFNLESYSTPRFRYFRTYDSSKNVGKEDFDLHVYKKAAVEEHPPPYYLDHWAKVCSQHNLPD